MLELIYSSFVIIYVFQLRNEVEKLDEKYRVTQNLLEHKVCFGSLIFFLSLMTLINFVN